MGLPEATLPLSQATILLATAPKSNSVYTAFFKANQAINTNSIGEVPLYLRDGHYSGAKSLGRAQGYKYPHDYENNFVKQDYMPKGLKNKKFYEPGNNKLEMQNKTYWDQIKGK